MQWTFVSLVLHERPRVIYNTSTICSFVVVGKLQSFAFYTDMLILPIGGMLCDFDISSMASVIQAVHSARL